MSRKRIGQIDVQYFLFLFTEEMKTLQSDRRQNEDAKMQFYLNEEEEVFIFSFENLLEKRQRKETPKPHIDIYILHEEAQELFSFIENIRDKIIGAVDLDRQIRNSKDPQFTYDGSRVPLQIDKTAGNFKVHSIQANLSKISKEVTWQREKDTDVDPYINVDLEHRRTRLHFGIGSMWDSVVDKPIRENRFEIVIPWSEFGQMYYSIKDAIN